MNDRKRVVRLRMQPTIIKERFVPMVFMPKAGDHIIEKARLHIVSADCPTLCCFSSGMRNRNDIHDFQVFFEEYKTFPATLESSYEFVTWLRTCMNQSNEIYRERIKNGNTM